MSRRAVLRTARRVVRARKCALLQPRRARTCIQPHVPVPGQLSATKAAGRLNQRSALPGGALATPSGPVLIDDEVQQHCLAAPSPRPSPPLPGEAEQFPLCCLRERVGVRVRSSPRRLLLSFIASQEPGCHRHADAHDRTPFRSPAPQYRWTQMWLHPADHGGCRCASDANPDGHDAALPIRSTAAQNSGTRRLLVHGETTRRFVGAGGRSGAVAPMISVPVT